MLDEIKAIVEREKKKLLDKHGLTKKFAEMDALVEQAAKVEKGDKVVNPFLVTTSVLAMAAYHANVHKDDSATNAMVAIVTAYGKFMPSQLLKDELEKAGKLPKYPSSALNDAVEKRKKLACWKRNNSNKHAYFGLPQWYDEQSGKPLQQYAPID